jgi:hypothetical protein
MNEEAPGIPSRKTSHEIREVSQPETWEYVVHKHEAERRGLHHDVRLGDPATGHGHSWAMEPAWPSPGESAWAVQQPTHTIPYFDFKGTILKGYGAGKVGIHDRAKTEVTNARPGHVSFNLYRGSGPEEYTLHRIFGDRWKLFNRTIHREKHPTLPSSKPDYREIDSTKVPFENDDQIMSAKIDGAHNLIVFPKAGEQIRVLSYRPTERATGVIEHTQKIEKIQGTRVPPGLSGTMLRGEVYAIDPRTKKALASKDLGGLLNSNVWDSREKQKTKGKLRIALIDAVFHRGKSVEDRSYTEKLSIMHKALDALPGAFELPKMAVTEKQKRILFEKIRAGEVPETSEGVVLWSGSTGAPPTKVKFRGEHDVYLRDFFEAKPGTKYSDRAVGGFRYSHTPAGPVVGRVGTGLSDKQRIDMHRDPDKYIGAVAKTRAMEVYPLMGKEKEKGAMRAPAFLGWHLDKNEQQRLDKMASPLERLLHDLSL